MTRPFRLFLALATLLAAATAHAQAPALETFDQGRLIVFERGVPVGIEHFRYEREADSVIVSATQTRTLRGSDGQEVKWVKKLGLVAGADDFGLRRYQSNLDYQGHSVVRGVMPGDTSMTIYSELDGAGDANRLTQPPGRLFVMDPMLFTLFDVVCRNLCNQSLPRRPIELVTLGEPPATVEAMATSAGPDTITWGGRRLVAKRWVLEDPSGRFLLWASPQGQMLRLLHEESGLEVLREEPAVRKPAAKPAAKSAAKSVPPKPAPRTR